MTLSLKRLLLVLPIEKKVPSKGFMVSLYEHLLVRSQKEIKCSITICSKWPHCVLPPNHAEAHSLLYNLRSAIGRIDDIDLILDVKRKLLLVKARGLERRYFSSASVSSRNGSLRSVSQDNPW